MPAINKMNCGCAKGSNCRIVPIRRNAFDLRYAGDVIPKDERWELCEKVLARNDVKKRLSRGWGERERADA